MKLQLLLAAVVCSALALAQTRAADEIEAVEEEFHATCPVSGGPAKETSFVAYKGKKLYFCCNNCPKKYEANPAGYTAKANRQLVETHQTVQVACPLTGKPMNTETSTAVSGITVNFCCEHCQQKVLEASEEEQLATVFGDDAKGFTLQTQCPISGGPIDPAASIEYKGQQVYFCCEGCPEAFGKNPEKYLAKLPQFSQESESESEEPAGERQ